MNLTIVLNVTDYGWVHDLLEESLALLDKIEEEKDTEDEDG